MTGTDEFGHELDAQGYEPAAAQGGGAAGAPRQRGPQPVGRPLQGQMPGRPLVPNPGLGQVPNPGLGQVPNPGLGQVPGAAGPQGAPWLAQGASGIGYAESAFGGPQHPNPGMPGTPAPMEMEIDATTRQPRLVMPTPGPGHDAPTAEFFPLYDAGSPEDYQVPPAAAPVAPQPQQPHSLPQSQQPQSQAQQQGRSTIEAPIPQQQQQMPQQPVAVAPQQTVPAPGYPQPLAQDAGDNPGYPEQHTAADPLAASGPYPEQHGSADPLSGSGGHPAQHNPADPLSGSGGHPAQHNPADPLSGSGGHPAQHNPADPLSASASWSAAPPRAAQAPTAVHPQARPVQGQRPAVPIQPMPTPPPLPERGAARAQVRTGGGIAAAGAVAAGRAAVRQQQADAVAQTETDPLSASGQRSVPAQAQVPQQQVQAPPHQQPAPQARPQQAPSVFEPAAPQAQPQEQYQDPQSQSGGHEVQQGSISPAASGVRETMAPPRRRVTAQSAPAPVPESAAATAPDDLSSANLRSVAPSVPAPRRVPEDSAGDLPLPPRQQPAQFEEPQQDNDEMVVPWQSVAQPSPRGTRRRPDAGLDDAVPEPVQLGQPVLLDPEPGEEEDFAERSGTYEPAYAEQQDQQHEQEPSQPEDTAGEDPLSGSGSHARPQQVQPQAQAEQPTPQPQAQAAQPRQAQPIQPQQAQQVQPQPTVPQPQQVQAQVQATVPQAQPQQAQVQATVPQAQPQQAQVQATVPQVQPLQSPESQQAQPQQPQAEAPQSQPQQSQPLQSSQPQPQPQQPQTRPPQSQPSEPQPQPQPQVRTQEPVEAPAARPVGKPAKKAATKQAAPKQPAPAAVPVADADSDRAPGYGEVEMEAVYRVIHERRDIRNDFLPDELPIEVLTRILEAAHTAPSVGFSQPWDFLVLRDEERRQAVHDLAVRQRKAYAASLPKARAKAFAALKIEAILDTPVNIVVTCDPTRGGRHTLGRYTQPMMAPFSTCLAVENLWLAARAEGLGVGWVSFFDERELAETLGLPEHLQIVAYLCVGYVKRFPDEPELAGAGWAKRRPLSWAVHEEDYGRRGMPGSEPVSLLDATVDAVRGLDEDAAAAARERQGRMTKPPGSLGMLEQVAEQLAGLAGQCPPPLPEPAALAVFAADHGVHAQGVTPWPQEVTAQMVSNFLAGGAVVNAFAKQVGAEVCVVDVGVNANLGNASGLVPRKVRFGTADMTQGPAMSRDEVLAAIEAGIETARDLVAAGNRCLLTGDMGIANTTASAALIAAFTGASPAQVTGYGTGIDEQTYAHKVEIVRRALELHRPDPQDPIGVLASFGGLEHAALAGFILGGAALRTPVVLDGVIAGAAALVAQAIAPEVTAACVAGHRSAEPGHALALEALGVSPLIDLELRLGEGSGAVLALPLVAASVRALREVATFDSAGVADASDAAVSPTRGRE
jgi:nicotinate-nucleotide--dimethylbenzimidazole phosphoribosyltransferase